MTKQDPTALDLLTQLMEEDLRQEMQKRIWDYCRPATSAKKTPKQPIRAHFKGRRG